VFGGNLDCKELVDGVSLFLPVFHKGALFYTGDSHSGQGDGEVTGGAIESANTAYLRFILHKGKTIKAPRAESRTHYIAFGLDPDLNKAMRMAITEAISYLGEKRGLNFSDAYTLCSQAVDFRVTQFVDKTVGIHAMISKKLFTDLKDDFWYKGP
jgi:acetamidase/formamidase